MSELGINKQINKNKAKNRRKKKSEHPKHNELVAISTSSKNDNFGINNERNTQVVKRRRVNSFTREISKMITNCTICEDNICNGTIMALPCGHGFGEICIDAWIYLHGRCPTCYFKVDHESVFPRSYKNSRNKDLSNVYTKALMNARKKIGVSGYLASSFVAGGEAASNLLEGAALVASEMITVGTTAGMQKNCEERNRIQPRMDAAEREQLRKRIETAKFVAGATATVTGCVASVVGTGLWALGSLVTPLIKRGSKRLLTELEMDASKANDVVEGTVELAKGALLSTGKILRGLEHATTVVASSAASNAARMYEFGRGLQPGELEGDVESIARNVVETAWNIRALPPKTLATISRTVQPPHKPSSTSVMRYEDYNYLNA